MRFLKEILLEYFGKLSEEDALSCMYDLLKSNRQNVGVVAEIAVKYQSKISTKKSIEVLESFGTNEGLLFFLANILPTLMTTTFTSNTLKPAPD